MAGPFDLIDPESGFPMEALSFWQPPQPDPFQDQDPIRFLGRVQAEAVAPEFADLARASQEVPTPNDYWARVAQGAGPQPFGPMQLGNKPTGLEVLLALASGFANAKAGQGARRVSEADQANQQAREAAKNLANRRWDKRLIQERADANLRNIIASRKPPQTPEEIRRVAGARRAGELDAETAAGSPPPRTGGAARKPPAVKPGPISPEINSHLGRLRVKSRNARDDGDLDTSERIDNDIAMVGQIHADIRQAQTAADLDAIDVPDNLDDATKGIIVKAARNRRKQLAPR